ncbi:hypothetical protein JJL56_10205 [Azospirillum sp. YIM DDC1]|uniref:DUF3300 domain-containing protein n=1 Tax=Azospirillum aestuarii TaxID=2802052 RepID=A0ABS1HWP4_9PROT|nr:hypothetical protein [Azospirillum aestuarii]MBK3775646.1 hypothetical protein [Azospirillum brasilense]MBK4719242.1 hypothetical protein [Azospirillum aestuarii]TWA90728.1 hypothetical protein FBY14_104232 [Azospirillum brasilense]
MSALISTFLHRIRPQGMAAAFRPAARMAVLGIAGVLALAVLPTAAEAHGPRDRGSWYGGSPYGGPSVIVPPPGSRVIVVPGYRPPPPIVVAPPPYWGPPPRHHHRRAWRNDWGPRPYPGPSVQFYGGWSSGRGW